ncbi:hypothetical protein O181_107727 [Austropuccinia psidii MF-1]|uniref:Uncharacterized protein n=1 Tax=Austropuccinia psidii MF-1 TaxID=1389203 RepID=A0A9Q3PPN8_9BASI|nr:hypothetical protein [Austropuccinia psidii MF-1]
MEPEREYSDVFRLTRSGKPAQLPSVFTSLRQKHIRNQESQFFPIPGIIPERDRIIGQEKYFFQTEKYKKQQIAVNNSNRIRDPATKSITPTQMKYNVVTPESNLNSDQLWLQMSQLAVKNQEKFDEPHSRNVRLQEWKTLQEATVKAIQESYAKLSEASEETNKRLNPFFKDEYHCKRDR